MSNKNINHENDKIVSFKEPVKESGYKTVYTPKEQARIDELKARENRIQTEIQLRINSDMGIPDGLRMEMLSIESGLLDIYMSKWTQGDIDRLNEICVQHDLSSRQQMAAYDAGMPEKAEEAVIYALRFMMQAAEKCKTAGIDEMGGLYDKIFYAYDSMWESERYLRNKYDIHDKCESGDIYKGIADKYENIPELCTIMQSVCLRLLTEIEKMETENVMGVDVEKADMYFNSFAFFFSHFLECIEEKES